MGGCGHLSSTRSAAHSLARCPSLPQCRAGLGLGTEKQSRQKPLASYCQALGETGTWLYIPSAVGNLSSEPSRWDTNGAGRVTLHEFCELGAESVPGPRWPRRTEAPQGQGHAGHTRDLDLSLSGRGAQASTCRGAGGRVPAGGWGRKQLWEAERGREAVAPQPPPRKRAGRGRGCNVEPRTEAEPGSRA